MVSAVPPISHNDDEGLKYDEEGASCGQDASTAHVGTVLQVLSVNMSYLISDLI